MCSKKESEEISSNNGIISSSECMTSKELYEEEEEEEEESSECECEEDIHRRHHHHHNHKFLLHFLQHSRIAETLHKLPLNEVREEIVSLGKISGAIVMTTLLIFSRSIISMLFLGHLGKVELAGGSLALGFGNITGNSILKGLAMGMDPICGQAFGAKRWSVLSQTYLKTLCLLLMVCVPISLVWLNVEPIFSHLGQDREITQVAKAYMVFSIPELFAQACLHPLRIFLRTQGLTAPLTIACVCSVILHLPINYILVIYLDMRVKGVALALALNTINLNLGLILYLFTSTAPLKPWRGASPGLSLLQGWRPLLALAIPSCLSVCLEWWWYEIILFLCGLLTDPKASVAAMGIMIQTTGLLYCFPFSLSSGICTRVGQALGANHPSRAQLVSVVGLTAALAFGLSASLLMTTVNSMWGRLYTDEPQVLNLVSSALPILGLCELGNSPQTAACGVLTATARPKVGLRINLCSFYLVGLPVAVLTTFVFKMGFQGLFFGLLAAQLSCVCMMAYTLIRTDWKHQAKRAEELTTAAGVDRNNNDLETGLLSDHQPQQQAA